VVVAIGDDVRAEEMTDEITVVQLVHEHHQHMQEICTGDRRQYVHG
jgi:hypothetical protein